MTKKIQPEVWSVNNGSIGAYQLPWLERIHFQLNCLREAGMGNILSSRSPIQWPAGSVTTARKAFRDLVPEVKPFGLKTLHDPKSAVVELVKCLLCAPYYLPT